jgi:hypothetical protein
MGDLPKFTATDPSSQGRPRLREPRTETGIRRAVGPPPTRDVVYASAGTTVLLASYGQIHAAETGGVALDRELIAADGGAGMPFPAATAVEGSAAMPLPAATAVEGSAAMPLPAATAVEGSTGIPVAEVTAVDAAGTAYDPGGIAAAPLAPVGMTAEAAATQASAEALVETNEISDAVAAGPEPAVGPVVEAPPA